MRRHFSLLAQTICEYIWKKKFYQAMESDKVEIRELISGDWYWVNKAVIRHTPKVRAMGIAVYNFLASLANRNQSCFPSQKYIAESLGYSRTTINKTLKLLEENGFIRIEKRSRYHCVYQLLKVRCEDNETQMSSRGNSDVTQGDSNNNKLTRNINNIVMKNRNFLNSSRNTFKRFRPRNKEQLLALDLTEALNDHKNLPLYLSYSKRYPESFLRKVLGEVKEVPAEKIKKSRGALFNYLVKKYAQNPPHNLSD